MRRQGSCEFNSSIALLQERFRNLQKVREMREGREQLLQITATTAAGATTTPAAPAAASAASPSSGVQPRWFSHTEQLVRRPSSSRPVQRADHVGEAGVQPPAVSVGRAAGLAVHSSGCRSDVEVDTSLHL
ncbi:hypothetical protein GUJ93_ZPchr0012g21918 [Zizania palustris]|uniref:Uncharacterized protein n=1 Tax=Zizania palustris TaxID=103762 RepID=A0A8J5WNF9_ZIZPA|nr:hypothetical protein GUJ93_ZPchr0012g21918 [Zizania palustris]